MFLPPTGSGATPGRPVVRSTPPIVARAWWRRSAGSSVRCVPTVRRVLCGDCDAEAGIEVVLCAQVAELAIPVPACQVGGGSFGSVPALGGAATARVGSEQCEQGHAVLHDWIEACLGSSPECSSEAVDAVVTDTH